MDVLASNERCLAFWVLITMRGKFKDMDKPASSDKAANKGTATPASAGSERKRRGWLYSLAWAAGWVGLAIGVSAEVNPLLDRSVHWDWVAGIAPTIFVGLALGYRRGWL